MTDKPTSGAYTAALDEARRQERITQAQWRRRRAELARLIAAGDEAAAEKLLREAGVDAATPTATDPVLTAVADPLVRPQPKASKRIPSRGAKSPPTGLARRASARPTSRPLGSLPTQRRSKKPQAGWLGWVRRRPPWLLSLAAHAAVLTALGLLSFTAIGQPSFELTSFMPDAAPHDEAPSPIELVDAQLDPLPEATSSAPAVIDLAAVVEPLPLTPAALGDALMLDAAALAVAVPASGAGQGEGEAAAGGTPAPQGAGRVRFFGAESEARRVAFVVDNSGSMKGGRLETTLIELDRAVQGLSHSQEFYVAFFSDQAYPMFYPDGVTEPLAATPENKRRLSRWLGTVEMCLGGRIVDAMELVAATEPDVVYLLTDGDIRSRWVVQRLTAPDEWPFVIQTLGMGARTAEHLAILQQIASTTGGQYRPVEAIPAAVRRAALKPIRYHRTPGQVWGSKVEPWD